MTSLTFIRRTSVIEKGNVTDKIRAFIAGHVGFDVDCVTVDSHFRDDLGMDLLDVVELMILIEDQFTDVEITDHEPEIEFVEDLIRHIEIVDDASGEITVIAPSLYSAAQNLDQQLLSLRRLPFAHLWILVENH